MQEEVENRTTALEIYVTGSLNVFNHQTNVDVHSRVVAYDIKELGNLVDEADLLALIDGDKTAPVCSCTTKCEAGAVNTSCEVCKTNMTECTGKEKVAEKVPDTTPEPEIEPEPEKKSSGGAVALLLLLLLGGGGALYWFKFRKKKPDAKGPVDLDDYDYGEEDDGEEYETEPDEAETADATQDAE